MRRLTELAVLALALVLLAAAGCDADETSENYGNPLRVCEAPVGACWDWVCEEDGCAAELPDTVDESWLPSCPEGEEVFSSWGAGRLFTINVFCDDGDDDVWGVWGYEGRPLECEADDECPRFEVNRYECEKGFCQNEDTESFPRDGLTRETALTLCYGGLKRSETVGWAPADDYVYDEVVDACPGSKSDAPCTGKLPKYCLSF